LCANATGSYCYGSANTLNLSTRFYQDFSKVTSTGDAPNALTGVDISSTVRGGSSGKYNGGFYYTCPTPFSNTGCTATYINDETAAVQQSFANWYSYYRTRNLLSRTALTRAYGSISGDVRVAWQTITVFVHIPLIRHCRHAIRNVGAWRNNFYNWIYNTVAGSTPNRRATALGSSRAFAHHKQHESANSRGWA
jgi:type IV pilus assembly protein PilY1